MPYIEISQSSVPAVQLHYQDFGQGRRLFSSTAGR